MGQGAGAIAVPVTYGKPVERTDICQPYSVAEVLQTVFHADFQTVLENYVRTETEQIQEAGVLPGTVQMKVRLWSYLKTFSKLQQPTDRTVVDVILKSKLEGRYKGGETRSEYEKENQALLDDGLLWMEFYKNIPDDFAEIIKAIMKRKGITQENLSFKLGFDRKALSNYLYQDRPSVAHVVGICVALKVPYFISMEILGAAGIQLRSTEQDFLYRQFLLNAENLTVSRCEDILKQHNEKPLFRGEQR